MIMMMDADVDLEALPSSRSRTLSNMSTNSRDLEVMSRDSWDDYSHHDEIRELIRTSVTSLDSAEGHHFRSRLHSWPETDFADKGKTPMFYEEHKTMEHADLCHAVNMSIEEGDHEDSSGSTDIDRQANALFRSTKTTTKRPQQIVVGMQDKKEPEEQKDQPHDLSSSSSEAYV